MIDNHKQPGEKAPDDGAKFMDIVLIQAPNRTDLDPGYNLHLLKHYKNSIPVQNIHDFIYRVIREYMRTGLPIRTMVIGSHGWAYEYNSSGHFNIGDTEINIKKDEEINKLRAIALYFRKDAHVYVMACKSGVDTALLQKVSKALGGLAVHGYTDWIKTTSYGPFGVKINTGTNDKASEIICWPGACVDITKGKLKF